MLESQEPEKIVSEIQEIIKGLDNAIDEEDIDKGDIQKMNLIASRLKAVDVNLTHRLERVIDKARTKVFPGKAQEIQKYTDRFRSALAYFNVIKKGNKIFSYETSEGVSDDRPGPATWTAETTRDVYYVSDPSISVQEFYENPYILAQDLEPYIREPEKNGEIYYKDKNMNKQIIYRLAVMEWLKNRYGVEDIPFFPHHENSHTEKDGNPSIVTRNKKELKNFRNRIDNSEVENTKPVVIGRIRLNQYYAKKLKFPKKGEVIILEKEFYEGGENKISSEKIVWGTMLEDGLVLGPKLEEGHVIVHFFNPCSKNLESLFIDKFEFKKEANVLQTAWDQFEKILRKVKVISPKEENKKDSNTEDPWAALKNKWG